MSTQALLEYYDSGIEDERLSRNLCNRLEWETTLHILAPYIPPSCHLLEVGAGYGHYSIHYSLLGHKVTAVELVPSQVAALKAKVARRQSGALEVYQGDARNLAMIGDASIDVVLCFGPLYHLQVEADRLQCLIECLRIAKPGGIVAIAYLSRFSAAALRINRDASILNTGFMDTLLEDGVIQGASFDPFTRSAYFTSPEEIEELVTGAHATILEHVATDTISKLMEQVVNAMTEEEYQRWYSYHLQTCGERTLLGYSTHGLVVCRKDGESNSIH
jgi:SAM-dependent methyltransferase